MPIYEFRCGSCAKEFEVLIRSSKDPSPPCPTCGGPATRKISVFSAQTGATSGGPAPMPGMCGCGKRMGSCSMDQG
ncbi:MAG: FmdB family zinc ribbon protein [Phycisphaerae bacterium]